LRGTLASTVQENDPIIADGFIGGWGVVVAARRAIHAPIHSAIVTDTQHVITCSMQGAYTAVGYVLRLKRVSGTLSAVQNAAKVATTMALNATIELIVNYEIKSSVSREDCTGLPRPPMGLVKR
jgi:hypothetical protein